MKEEKTVTIGSLLCKLSTAEDYDERKEALEELDEVVIGHPDESFIRVCMDEAEKGNFSANIGRCVPPDMYDDEITFENDDFENVIAKW